MKLAHNREILFRRQIASSLSFTVRLRHEVRVCGASPKTSAIKLISARSWSPTKQRFVDLVHLRQILSAQPEAVLFGKTVFNCLKILGEQPVVCRRGTKCLKDRCDCGFL